MGDLEIMIILIEGEYFRSERNTAEKMKNLLLKEFGYEISKDEILRFYGLTEDYEMESKRIENGYY